MKEEKVVPHTILEEILTDTLSQLSKSDFDEETILKLEKHFNSGKISPDDLISILRSD